MCHMRRRRNKRPNMLPYHVQPSIPLRLCTTADKENTRVSPRITVRLRSIIYTALPNLPETIYGKGCRRGHVAQQILVHTICNATPRGKNKRPSQLRDHSPSNPKPINPKTRGISPETRSEETPELNPTDSL